MIQVCEMPLCPNIRSVVVHQTTGGRVRVCIEHLLDALDAHDGQVLAFWKVATPICDRTGCEIDALRRAPEIGGHSWLVCRQHFDDLSWTETPSDLLPDETGWSHG